jgi:uncharacterized protein
MVNKGCLAMCRFALVCLLVYSNSLFAQSVNNLYEVTVPVKDQSAASRGKSIKLAFSQVLVKVSGISDLMSRGDLLKQAQRYVEQYRYGVVDDQDPIQSEPQKTLWVKFEKTAVDSFLLESGASVWGDSRPVILSWMAIDQQGVRTLSDDIGYWPMVTALGENRGLPLLLPLMDLDDQINIQFSDVWGDFAESIKHASTRYAPDGILVNRITQQENGIWMGRWTLYLGETAMSWQVSDATSLDELMALGVGQAVDSVAKQYATSASMSASGGSSPFLEVDNIYSLTDYSRVLGYFVGLTQVENIRPVEFLDNRVTFVVTLVGDESSLIKSVEISDVLHYLPGVGIEEGSQGRLNFSLTH